MNIKIDKSSIENDLIIKDRSINGDTHIKTMVKFFDNTFVVRFTSKQAAILTISFERILL